jgi:hypothetical protein
MAVHPRRLWTSWKNCSSLDIIQNAYLLNTRQDITTVITCLVYNGYQFMNSHMAVQGRKLQSFINFLSVSDVSDIIPISYLGRYHVCHKFEPTRTWWGEKTHSINMYWRNL